MTTNPLNDRLAFMIEHLDLPEATGIPDATWESFQVSFLNYDGLLDISRKARQIGWSWIAAADAVAHAILYKNTPHVFVSISQDEAKEKIRYAKQIMEALDTSVRPKRFIADNQQEIELPNGSRFISHPCKPPRGKGRVRIYLDEFAHYPIAEEIYTAALPVTTRGGVLRIGSTPLGATGKFWEIYAQRLKQYPGFVRRYLPWWVTRGLCKDVKTAIHEASNMPTEDRVKKFGSIRLIQIFENMVIEDFQQEYECAWVDESVSWITWDEIKKNQILDTNGRLQYELVNMKDSGDLIKLTDALERLKNLQLQGLLQQLLAAGMDIGRQRNASEICIVGMEDGYYPFVLGVTLENCSFDVQKAAAKEVIKILKPESYLIDKNGLGMNLSEELSTDHPEVVTGIDFTSGSKKAMATTSKLLFQRGKVPIPINKELSYQIHSIRRKVSASGVTQFDTEGNEKHHADKFWAHALALYHAADVEQQEASWGAAPF